MRASALLFTLLAGTSAALSMLACGDNADTDEGGIGTRPASDVGSSGNTSSAGTAGEPTGGTSGTSGTVTPAAPPEHVNLTTVSTTHAGKPRSYILGLPKTYDPNRSYPLVMLLHGNPGTKEKMRQLAPMDQATKGEAILVYPDSADGSWDLYTPTDSNRDMNWLRGLPSELAATYNIDQSHVDGFGFSGGAFMLAQMSCRFGQQAFHAVYINSGGGPDETRMGYSKRADKTFVCPGGPIPTLIVHGEVDGQVVKASGQFTATTAAQNNGCSDFPKTPTSPQPCVLGASCSKTTEWCLVPKLGHAIWDQGLQTAWTFFNAN